MSMGAQNRIFIVALGALFLLSFSLPVLYGVSSTGLLATLLPDEPREVPRDEVFPTSRAINASDGEIRVKHAPTLDPAGGAALIIASWFKVKRLPERGGRMILLAKFDSAHRHRPGYALSLSEDGGRYRPGIYWRDGAGTGKWFSFSEFAITPREWFMLALTFHDDRFLGLHGSVPVPGQKAQVVLLGGYDLGAVDIPSSGADLVVAPVSGHRFTGRVGPIGLFSGIDLSERYRPILKSLAREPLEIPDQLDDEEVHLWIVDGAVDRSPLAQQVESAVPRATRTAQLRGPLKRG